jgi:hypothetical protein
LGLSSSYCRDVRRIIALRGFLGPHPFCRVKTLTIGKVDVQYGQRDVFHQWPEFGQGARLVYRVAALGKKARNLHAQDLAIFQNTDVGHAVL